MTEDVQEPKVVETKDELSLLKQRADLMGITYSNNIGVEKLKERIAEATPAPDEPEPVEKVKDALSERQEFIREATKLVRLRITNNNPAKREMPGEIFTVANGAIGTIRKYIPYDHTSEVGYHVPNVIYKMLKRKTYNSLVSRRNEQGVPIKESVVRKEFNLEVLDPLTKEELDKLAQDQRAAGRV